MAHETPLFQYYYRVSVHFVGEEGSFEPECLALLSKSTMRFMFKSHSPPPPPILSLPVMDLLSLSLSLKVVMNIASYI